tara:strand:- start:3075 stop:4691 length:1617 start_codon:yes stop_codon:yes gene_type:complete
MPQIPRPAFIFPLLFLLAVIAGYYIIGTKPSDKKKVTTEKETSSHPRTTQLPENKSLSRTTRRQERTVADQTTPPFALENERIARFKSEADYQKFLASLKRRGLNLLGKSDRLMAVRFGFGFGDGFDPNDIDDADLSYNYLVSIPAPPSVQAQAGATGFGRNALSWLGIDGDNSAWGKGITVAVLDSGVNDHIALNGGNGNITTLTLTELADGSEQLGHGTAVASIISGDHVLTPGIAPASDILSIRITDSEGASDSFTLAQGILEAADAGSKIINISMGSYGNSSVVLEAVQYAQEKGAVIVASSGNEGLDNMAYPAAYDGVISVGAVEANGEHLDFSNSGESLDVVAPGYQVNAAWGDEQLTSFSGTSASAPFISGAIAAAMSENPHITAQQAADLVLGVTNDAGYPGDDTAYGSGILAMDRVMENGTPGIYDAAITSQVLVLPNEPTSLPQVLVTVQNQGTETLINSPISITSPTGTQTLNISSLAPGQIQTFPVPVRLPPGDASISVNSSVQITETDKDPSNNSQSSSFTEEQP